mgnify:CR=1 FL=1
MKCIEVVAAVFQDKNKNFFCARRGNSGELALKWEFPGGKIEKGESREEALIREISEELLVSISVDEYIMTVEHQYPSFLLTMHVFKCSIQYGSMKLTEHTDSKWLPASWLDEIDWAEADIPSIDKLKKDSL